MLAMRNAQYSYLHNLQQGFLLKVEWTRLFW